MPYPGLLDNRMRPGSPGALAQQGQGLLAQIRSRLSRPGLSSMLGGGGGSPPIRPDLAAGPQTLNLPPQQMQGAPIGPRPMPMGGLMGGAPPMGGMPPMGMGGGHSVSQLLQSPEFLGAAPGIQAAIRSLVIGQGPQPPGQPPMPTGPSRLMGGAGRPGLVGARPGMAGLSRMLGG